MEIRAICIELPPALKALAEPTRLKIMLMLEGRPRTVSEIVDFFDFSQPTITRHLQTLQTAGLVKREKKGQRVYYSANAEVIRSLCSDLTGCFPQSCCDTEMVEVVKKTRSKSRTKANTGARPKPKPKKGKTS